MAEAYIVDAIRIPRGIGKKGKGALANMLPQHLAATVLKAIKDRNNLSEGAVEDVIWGTSAHYGMVTMCTAGGMAPALIIERV